MYLQKLKIGNVETENNIFLAPMAGITDLPFRLICRSCEFDTNAKDSKKLKEESEYLNENKVSKLYLGPGLEYTEMVSSKAIFYNDEKTKNLMDISKDKRPIAVQIFGSDPETMGYAGKYVSDFADIVDINMGCPAPKVTKNGDGSKLLLDLDLARKAIRAVVQNSKVPVTLKFRKGWDSQNIVACELAKIAEEEGISAITIHGRTRADYYSGTADLSVIKKVKESVKIPVIGNGDIVNEESAKRMFQETGVDGIMIGRATLGNPWIFGRIIYFLQTGEMMPKISKEERLFIIKKHLELEIQEKDEYTAIREFRKHLSAYTKNLPNSSNFRNNVNKIEDKEELLNAIGQFFIYCD